MSPKVLATSWHPGGMNAIVKPIRRLLDEAKVDVLVLGHEYSRAILDGHSIRHSTIEDYELPDVSRESMSALIEHERPDLILTGTSQQDERNRDVIEQTVTLAAREHGVTSLAVLDFWSSYSARFNDIHTGERFRFLPDYVAIMDHYAERDMLAEGFEKRRLVITGNPHFDDLETKSKQFTESQRREIRQKMGLEADILVFYAANAWKKELEHNGYWDLDNIRLIGETLSEMDGIAGAAIKLHPRAPEADVAEVSAYTGPIPGLSLLTDIDPQQLVLASDLTFTPYSTLGIEAVYMGRPCISLQPNLASEDHLEVLTKNRIIPAGYTTQECKRLIKRALGDSAYREELIEQASSFRTDGKATERVTGLVYKLLHQ